MTLRKKSIIIIVLVSLLVISLVNMLSRLILLNGFSNLEEDYCFKNSQRAFKAVTNEEKYLSTLVEDYAVWDDTYTFVDDLNPAYVNANITPPTFARLNLNFFIITNTTGQVIAAYGYDLVNNTLLTVQPEILDLITKKQIFRDTGIDTNSVGFVLINSKPVLLAYHAILSSASLGPSRGLLIIGRFLGDDFITQLSDTTQLAIQIESYQNSALSLELQTAKLLAGRKPEIFVKILDPQSIAGYIVFQDIFGDPTIILRTVSERDIYNHGYTTIIFFISVVFFGSVFFFLTAIYMLDKHVISRITSLGKAVTNVRLLGALADRVPVKSKDEISSLASEINEMLQSLEAADFKLRHSRDELEILVEERTAKLVQVNDDLNHEIAEHELSQKNLLEAYNEIHLIISSIASIMIGVDNRHIVTMWNDTAVRMFGLSSTDVIGQDFFTLPIRWDWERISQETAICSKNNTKVRMEDVHLGTQGNDTCILGITLTPLILKDNDYPGFLLIGSDITKRRLLEDQLVRSKKMEAIGQLAAGVAHEMNTPTQLVGSNLRFLGQQFELVLGLIDKVYQLNQAVKAGTANPAMAISLEKASAAVHLEFFRQEAPKAIEQSLVGIERISHIITAMRFFTHPGSEKKEIANLNQIIQNALSLSVSEWKNVAEIKTDLDPDLPDIECLPIDLSQVVLNIIINAVHAIQDVVGEDPESKGQIFITSRQIKESIEIRITDTGTGIPEEIRDKIFDLFFTTKDVGRGTGQGLAIAYSVIVNKHGGTLEFESELGRGTTFIIHLPRKVDND